MGTIKYQLRWQGKIWERFGEFEVCQEADGDWLTDKTFTRDTYASKNVK